MRCSPRILVAAVFSLLLDGRVASAQEWCDFVGWDPWPVSAMPIRWRLNTSPTGSVQTLCDYSAANGQGCATVEDVRHVFEDVFAEIRNASGAEVEFVYDGTTELPPGTRLVSGTDCSAPEPTGCLHIWHDPSCGGTYGYAAADPPSWAAMGLCVGPAQPLPFAPWQRGLPPDAISLHSVAMQEVMHILGMGHYEDCGSTSSGVMAALYEDQPSQHLSSVDIHFLDANYGATRDNWVGNRRSGDALTWYANTSFPATFQGRFAATNNLQSSSVFLAWLTWFAGGSFQLARVGDDGWTFPGTLTPSGLARYHPGIANDAGSTVFVDYGGNYDATTARFDIVERVSSTGGTSFASAANVSTVPTVMPGVSTTFDPESSERISVWRRTGTGVNGNGTIVYRIGDSPVAELPLQAADTPSIACGPASVVGTDNCLLAYPSSNTWGHVVKWTQCTVAGTISNHTLDCPNSIRTHPFFTVGSPSVAYSASSSTAYPWHIALSQGGVTFFAWRKGPTPAEAFRDQRSFYYGTSSPVGLPAAASRQFTTPPYRRYVFIPYFNR